MTKAFFILVSLPITSTYFYAVAIFFLLKTDICLTNKQAIQIQHEDNAQANTKHPIEIPIIPPTDK